MHTALSRHCQTPWQAAEDLSRARKRCFGAPFCAMPHAVLSCTARGTRFHSTSYVRSNFLKRMAGGGGGGGRNYFFICSRLRWVGLFTPALSSPQLHPCSSPSQVCLASFSARAARVRYAKRCFDHGTTRTCNLGYRKPAPCPLGHAANIRLYRLCRPGHNRGRSRTSPKLTLRRLEEGLSGWVWRKDFFPCIVLCNCHVSTQPACPPPSLLHSCHP